MKYENLVKMTFESVDNGEFSPICHHPTSLTKDGLANLGFNRESAQEYNFYSVERLNARFQGQGDEHAIAVKRTSDILESRVWMRKGA